MILHGLGALMQVHGKFLQHAWLLQPTTYPQRIEIGVHGRCHVGADGRGTPGRGVKRCEVEHIVPVPEAPPICSGRPLTHSKHHTATPYRTREERQTYEPSKARVGRLCRTNWFW